MCQTYFSESEKYPGCTEDTKGHRKTGSRALVTCIGRNPRQMCIIQSKLNQRQMYIMPKNQTISIL